MRFLYARALYLLWLLPVLITFYIAVKRKKEKDIALFGDKGLLEKITPGFSPKREKIRIWLSMTVFLFFILSLSGPQVGTKLRDVKRRGVDIIIALDTSLSMMAEDIKPNRLSKAKRMLISFINQLKGDRIGIIAFSGKAFLQCPLTLDYSAARMILGIIDSNLIPMPGTAIGEAIRLAIKSFSRRERRYKVLVLLTDGEDHRSNPLKAAEEAKKEGIKIYTIGIGTPQGEPIPLRNERGNVTGYKKDKKGETVLSQLDEMTLQKIALTCGGKYYRSTAGEIEVEKIYDEIDKMEKKELQSKLYAQYEDRFQYPLFLAFLLLAIELIIPERKKRAGIAPVVLIALCSLLATSAQASLRSKINKGNNAFKRDNFQEALKYYRDAQVDSPESHEVHFNMGAALYKNKKYEDAMKEYEKATYSKDLTLQADSYYNMGNTLYRMGKLPEAIQYYKKALEINPDDQDAKYNIEFIQRKLKERLKKESGQESADAGQKGEKDRKQGQGDQEKKGEEKRKADAGKEEGKEKEEGPQKKPKKEGEMSEEEARRILEALQDEEKEALKKKMKMQPQIGIPEEDW